MKKTHLLNFNAPIVISCQHPSCACRTRYPGSAAALLPLQLLLAAVLCALFPQELRAQDSLALHPEPCTALCDSARHTPAFSLNGDSAARRWQANVPTMRYQTDPHELRMRSLWLPGALFAAGLLGNVNDWADVKTRTMMTDLQHQWGGKTGIDDYTQFAPLAASFALQGLGVKSRHTLKEHFFVGLMSFALSQAILESMKYTIRRERPDGSTRNSFPSGHTAMAFLGAEVLYQEYKHVSPWIGYAGYAVATGTGLMRMYNNRHWLTDVVAGAGLGILCTKAAYWLYPKIFHPKNRASAAASTYVVMPYAAVGQQSAVGLQAALTF